MDSIAQNKSAIQTLLNDASTIGIVVSEHQTIDVLAAALSLHLIFQDSGKNSQIISKKEPIVEQSFLVGIDQMVKSFTGSTKTLTVSFPYHDGDIEKVSYNIEGDRLNVNLFAEEQGITFTEKDIKYIREGSSPQLIVTVGVVNQGELDGIVDPSAKIINIDNNVANSLFGTVPVVNPAYSSVSEIVAKLAIELGLQVEFDVAQNLLDGIAFATQDFSSPKTSPVAFEMIGVLMQKGAVRKSMKDIRSSADTSLSMLNKPQKPFGQPQPFGNPQGKPFDSAQGKPFGNPQGKPFDSVQSKQQKPFVNNKPFINSQPFNQAQPFDSAPADAYAMAGKQGKPFGNSQGNQFGQPAANPMPSFNNQQPRQPFDSFSNAQDRSAQGKPQQPRQMPSYEDTAPVTSVPDDSFAPQIPTEIPSEDEAPSDWFTPKVFSSTKNQQ